jgi:hypothetical protein
MRRWRHDNYLLARRAVDLCAGITCVALDVLGALRTGKFEFSHNFSRAAERAGSD